jgi:hypothetical protein
MHFRALFEKSAGGGPLSFQQENPGPAAQPQVFLRALGGQHNTHRLEDDVEIQKERAAQEVIEVV